MTEAGRREKIEVLKERMKPKCVWWYRDGAGGYCKLKKDTSGFHTHYRTLCFGRLGMSCIFPNQHKEEQTMSDLAREEALHQLASESNEDILEATGKGWNYKLVEEDQEVINQYGWKGLLIADADRFLAALEGNDEHPQVKQVKREE